uniref:Pentatricopeptide repeat-containing protein n=1 Tax=Oryza glumipatula TaxID=40148 RepID=A0A0D9Z679_9ORYZ
MPLAEKRGLAEYEHVLKRGLADQTRALALIPYSLFGNELLDQCLHGPLKSGFTANSPVSTAITILYCRLNDMESARKAFNAMPEKTTESESWKAIIPGYA